MICSFSELRTKEIVDVKTGLKIGYADDIGIDTSNGTIVSMTVYGKSRALGLLGRDDDITIKCSDIELIGEDAILGNYSNSVKTSNNASYHVDNLSKTTR